MKWYSSISSNETLAGALYETQQGKCGICGVTDRLAPFVIDHDHFDGHVRGLLCRRCNALLGAHMDKFGKDFWMAALRYVTHPPSDKVCPSRGEKRCARCKLVKPLGDFYHYRGKAISYCKSCNTEYHKEQQAKKLRKSEQLDQ